MRRLSMVAKTEDMLRGAGIALPIILHGVSQHGWELIDVAAKRGYDTRIGFEDVLTLPDGGQAKSNAELVAEAVRNEFWRARHGPMTRNQLLALRY